jgi:hypothetical protein
MLLLIPATAPLGLDYTFSVQFSNLAALFVNVSNLNVIVYPSLQVCAAVHLV